MGIIHTFVAQFSQVSINCNSATTLPMPTCTRHVSENACLFLGRNFGEVGKSLASLEFGVLNYAYSGDRLAPNRSRIRRIVLELLTSVCIAREISRPFDERAAFVVSRGDRKQPDGTEHRRIRQFGRRCDHTIRDEVIDRLESHVNPLQTAYTRCGLTLCSSCFTSRTVPSLNDHLTTSVSSFALLTNSLLVTADQLQKCQSNGER